MNASRKKATGNTVVLMFSANHKYSKKTWSLPTLTTLFLDQNGTCLARVLRFLFVHLFDAKPSKIFIFVKIKNVYVCFLKSLGPIYVAEIILRISTSSKSDLIWNKQKKNQILTLARPVDFLRMDQLVSVVLTRDS